MISRADLRVLGPHFRQDTPAASGDWDSILDIGDRNEVLPDPHGDAVRARDTAEFQADLERRIQAHRARIIAAFGDRRGQRGRKHAVIRLTKPHRNGALAWFPSAAAAGRTVDRAADNVAKAIKHRRTCAGHAWAFCEQVGEGQIIVIDGARWFLPADPHRAQDLLERRARRGGLGKRHSQEPTSVSF